MEIIKKIKKEIEPVLLFIAALIVFGTLSVFGMVYNLGKSIYECFQVKFWEGLFKFVGYWLRVLYQLWNIVKRLLVDDGLAICIDYFGNVSAGEMCEDCCTTREDTLFGKGDVTLSAAIGKEEVEGFLVKFGWGVTKMLSIVLGKNHSVDAYKKLQTK